MWMIPVAALLASPFAFGDDAVKLPNPSDVNFSGWTTAGLFAAALAWFAKVWLPSMQKQMTDFMTEKDKKISEMVALLVGECDRNRNANYAAIEAERKRLGDVIEAHRVEYAQIQAAHLRDAEKDRDAFLRRSEMVVMAIEKQTVNLQMTMGAACKFAQAAPMPIGERDRPPG